MNRWKREQLAKVFFDVAKYLLTVGVVGLTLKPEGFYLKGILIGLAETVAFLVAGWFTAPRENGNVA